MTTPMVVFLMVSAVCNGFIVTMVQGSDQTTAKGIQTSLENRVSLPFKTLCLFTVLTITPPLLIKLF